MMLLYYAISKNGNSSSQCNRIRTEKCIKAQIITMFAEGHKNTESLSYAISLISVTV